MRKHVRAHWKPRKVTMESACSKLRECILCHSVCVCGGAIEYVLLPNDGLSLFSTVECRDIDRPAKSAGLSISAFVLAAHHHSSAVAQLPTTMLFIFLSALPLLAVSSCSSLLIGSCSKLYLCWLQGAHAYATLPTLLQLSPLASICMAPVCVSVYPPPHTRLHFLNVRCLQ